MLVTDGYWNEGNPSRSERLLRRAESAGVFARRHGFQPQRCSRRAYSGTCRCLRPARCSQRWRHGLLSVDGGHCVLLLGEGSAHRSRQHGAAVCAGQDDRHHRHRHRCAPATIRWQNKEIYFNPTNDPASWQHVVQFMVTLGIAGKLQFSERRGLHQSAKRPLQAAQGPVELGRHHRLAASRAQHDPQAIDDTWHAAINSRGSYFSASNPTALVQHLTDIINNILSRKGTSTALSATMSTLTAGTQGYSAGYDTSDYSGLLFKQNLDPETGEAGATIWDAGCLLTGGTFSAGRLHAAAAARCPMRASAAGSSRQRFRYRVAIVHVVHQPYVGGTGRAQSGSDLDDRNARPDGQHQRVRRQRAGSRGLAARRANQRNDSAADAPSQLRARRRSSIRSRATYRHRPAASPITSRQARRKPTLPRPMRTAGRSRQLRPVRQQQPESRSRRSTSARTTA